VFVCVSVCGGGLNLSNRHNRKETDRARARGRTERVVPAKHASFLNFRYGCPEPVLTKLDRVLNAKNDAGQKCVSRTGCRQEDTCALQKTPLLSAFPYVCPEPVLVNRSVSCKRGSRKTPRFRTERVVVHGVEQCEQRPQPAAQQRQPPSSAGRPLLAQAAGTCRGNFVSVFPSLSVPSLSW
jgi:hypothetical protein